VGSISTDMIAVADVEVENVVLDKKLDSCTVRGNKSERERKSLFTSSSDRNNPEKEREIDLVRKESVKVSRVNV